MNNLEIIQSKCASRDEVLKKIQRWQQNNERVVFTNGCFDILHLGHITYLAQAADKGDKLVVALNTDASVRKQNKGPERPINPEHARMAVLAALRFVDAVLLFDAETPIDEISVLKPDVLVKGADYDPECKDPLNKKYIVGSDVVRSYGGEVVAIPLVEGFSTTNVVRKLSQK